MTLQLKQTTNCVGL